MGLDKQGAQPTGIIGKLIGRLMNKFHTALYIKYFKNNLPPNNAKILDIGCGGGKFLQFLSSSNKSYLLFGLDHSPVMIALSAKINKIAIAQNRLKLIQSVVREIPLADASIDLVTAFETVQFWPDTETSFLELNRLLKTNGKLLIINRYPSEDSKWWKMAKIKNDKEYIAKLEKAGFNHISVNLKFKNGWIIVDAHKK